MAAYYFLKSLLWLVSLIPLAPMRALGRCLGLLWYRLDKRHRGIVQDNLKASFPEKDRAWIEATARGCFQHVARVMCEIPVLVRKSPEAVEKKWVRWHGVEHIDRARAKGRGIFILTGHIGNWEWTAFAAGRRIGPAVLVARPVDWPPAERLVKYWRTKSGHSLVPKAGSARALLREVRKGGIAAALLDQNVDWYDGEWVDFFGRPACTNKGLALLARATETPVVPYYSVRAADGKLDIYFEPEIPLVKTGDKTMDIWHNTQNYTKALENIIRRNPEQWFWLHQRWKTKPFHLWPRQK